MGLCVIIVDDEKAPRELLKKFLPWQSMGFTIVKTVDDGEKALELAHINAPDIIISDIKMPRLNGIELARRVRCLWPECRFVFLSGYPDKEYLKDAIKLNVAGFLEKPIDLLEVEELLRELAQKCICEKTEDVKWSFFREYYGGNEPLNGKISTIPKSTMTQLLTIIKSGDKIDTLCYINEISQLLRTHEGTDPEYIRNIFYRIVLLFIDMAEGNQVKSVISLRDTLLHRIADATNIKTLETVVHNLAEEYFCGVSIENPSIVARVDQYMELHFSQSKLTVQEMADDLGFVNTYLCMAYKKVSGKTVIQQLTTMRIIKAKQLLLNSNDKLYQVGSAVGYSDPKYFTKVFTKEVGITPRQYRQEHHHEL